MVRTIEAAHKNWACSMEKSFKNENLDIHQQYEWWKSFVRSDSKGNRCRECTLEVAEEFLNDVGCVRCDVCYDPMLFHKTHRYVLKTHAPTLFTAMERHRAETTQPISR